MLKFYKMIGRRGLPFKIRAPLNRLKNQCEVRDLDILSLSLRSGIYEYLKTTPLQKARCMSENKNVFLKREDLNPTFSFYIRCAINQLINEKTEETVVTSSVGSRGYCLHCLIKNV
jgi:tryptophan synthase beta subunit